MNRIVFSDLESERRALGRVAGRHPIKDWVTGAMLVPEAASAFRAVEGISFHVEDRLRRTRALRRFEALLQVNDGQ